MPADAIVAMLTFTFLIMGLIVLLVHAYRHPPPASIPKQEPSVGPSPAAPAHSDAKSLRGAAWRPSVPILYMNATVGRVAHLSKNTEHVQRFIPTPYTETYLVWTFQIERTDAHQKRLPNITVKMRGKRILADVHNGMHVAVPPDAPSVWEKNAVWSINHRDYVGLM